MEKKSFYLPKYHLPVTFWMRAVVVVGLFFQVIMGRFWNSSRILCSLWSNYLRSHMCYVQRLSPCSQSWKKWLCWWLLWQRKWVDLNERNQNEWSPFRRSLSSIYLLFLFRWNILRRSCCSFAKTLTGWSLRALRWRWH